jgi:hypothetical protein
VGPIDALNFKRQRRKVWRDEIECAAIPTLIVFLFRLPVSCTSHERRTGFVRQHYELRLKVGNFSRRYQSASDGAICFV